MTPIMPLNLNAIHAYYWTNLIKEEYRKMGARQSVLHRLQPYFISALVLMCLCVLPPSSFAAGKVQEGLNLDSKKYQSLIKELVEKHQFEVKYLEDLFNQVVIKKDIIEKFERPAEHLPFYKYRKIFIKEDMIQKGHAYIEKNRELLTIVEKKYGVPKEVIASILGVETRFGKPGIERYRAFDVYNTAFALYPRREKFYRGELIAFLKLCRNEGFDPLSIKSSYAGAFGVPQFIPSSYLRYAVDFDGDGKKDLWHSKADIYGSVASYLKTFGWKPGQLSYLPARIARESLESKKISKGHFRKTLPVAKAIRVGIDVPPPAKGNDLVSFAYYEPKQGEKALLALFGNFRAIARYNISVHYSLTIIELSRIFAMKGMAE